MDNKKIDEMLNTLRKHSPDWVDEIRRYINKLEYKLLAYRRPIGYSVKNVRQEAKKEVFDDLDKQGCDKCLSYRQTKQRHFQLFKRKNDIIIAKIHSLKNG